MEKWKIINEKGYEVSSLGRVKNKDGKLLSTYLSGKYLRVYVGEKIHVHVLVAMAFHGHVRCGYKRIVNHIDLNKLNNRAENIEVITPRENTNQLHLKSASKYVGVSRSGRKWKARMKVNGKSKYLGTFATEKEAGEKYQNSI